MPLSDAQILSRLYVRPPRSRRRTYLERLKIEDQQYWSTQAARALPWKTHLMYEDHHVMQPVPCADLIALCPPDIQPAMGVPWSQPACFPVWIAYQDGRLLMIKTPEDLARKPLGYLCYPRVPFPALPSGSPLAGMGETFYGPFAPHLCGYPSLDSLHPDDIVFATEPITYGERSGPWRRSVGEHFALEGLLDDTRLLTQGVIERANPCGQRLLHEQTERVFGEKDKLTAYAQRYDDTGDMGWIPHASGKTTAPAVGDEKGATSPEVPQVSHETTLSQDKKARIHQEMLKCLQGKRSITVQALAPLLGMSNIAIRRLFEPYPGLYKAMKAEAEREYVDKPHASPNLPLNI